jgi:hypothetical protein
MVIEKMIQTKSKGKKSLGFGKNDLNIMPYIKLRSNLICYKLYAIINYSF